MEAAVSVFFFCQQLRFQCHFLLKMSFDGIEMADLGSARLSFYAAFSVPLTALFKKKQVH